MEFSSNYSGLNSTFNRTGGNSNSSFQGDFYATASKRLLKVSIPVIFLVGFIGNSLSLVVFSKRRMRRLPSSQFVTALAVVDNVFLASLIITWFDGIWMPLMESAFTCRCVIYTTYVSSFLSVWYIVCFSSERYLAICFPLRRHMCTAIREKQVICTLTILACVLYLFNFWTVITQDYGSRYGCAVNMYYITLMETVTWVDTAITMIIPFMVILFTNVKVLCAVRRRCKGLDTRCTTVPCRCRSPPVVLRSTLSTRNIQAHARVTWMLMLVSTTFLVLNFPSHAIRIFGLLRDNLPGDSQIELPVGFPLYQAIGTVMFYATFGCNFFLYALLGRNYFKTSFKVLFRCYSPSGGNRECIPLQSIFS